MKLNYFSLLACIVTAESAISKRDSNTITINERCIRGEEIVIPFTENAAQPKQDSSVKPLDPAPQPKNEIMAQQPTKQPEVEQKEPAPNPEPLKEKLAEMQSAEKKNDPADKNNPPKEIKREPKPKPAAPPKKSPKKSPGLKLSAWEEESLNRHNKYRNQLVTKDGKDVDEFKWRPDLAEKAREWANYLVEKSKKEGNGIGLEHSSAKNWGHGENLYSTMNGDMGCGAAIDAWFNEWPLYKNEPIGQGDFSGYGHYTQLAWPDSKFIGCAHGDNGDNIRFTVCEYDPPGNFAGQPLNVFVKGKQQY